MTLLIMTVWKFNVVLFKSYVVSCWLQENDKSMSYDSIHLRQHHHAIILIIFR